MPCLLEETDMVVFLNQNSQNLSQVRGLRRITMNAAYKRLETVHNYYQYLLMCMAAVVMR